MQSHANTHNVMKRTAQLPRYMGVEKSSQLSVDVSTVNAEHQTLNVFTVRYPQTQHELFLPGIFLESPPAHRSTVAQSFFGAVLLNTPLAHMTSPCLEMGNNQWAKSMPLSLQERERPFQDTQSKRNGSLELVEYTGYTFLCSPCS